MTTRCSALRATTLAAFTTSVALFAGCAPDAWQNVRATGLNDWLDTVQSQCQPLWVGNMYLPRIDASAVPGQESRYTEFLDIASRFYYGRLSPAEFRNGVQSLGGASGDPRTNNSIDCMIAKRPTDRPTSPGGAAR